ncbi:phage tail tip lysozyme [Mesorhizobium sp. B2-3-2]|uniref:phage tail tip lysozyme n=1 Tax=Mesorhizobium sp. B2-3-2 TaxID=2589961 RepID=UPI00112B0163|nr:phage tail tip lysozyme [Mesorhizobium sp. B2-3-2]TPM37053.1 hypothetical protein FJ964_30430 [Mesorhizobium sp. B2-3-2]
MQATARGYQSGKDFRDEKNAQAAFGKYLDSLQGQQQSAPQTLSSLAPQFGPSAPVGAVQRAPLGTPDPATARVDQAFAAQGQTSANTLNGNQIAGRFLKTVKDGGLTNPFALAAVAATGKNESGFAPNRAFGTWSDPSQSGQAGTSGGIMSWRGDRLAKLQAFAQQNGDNPQAPSPETQGKFLLAEDPSLIQKLNAAQSPAEAQQIMNQAWRFAGYDQPGGEAGQRIADAQAFAPQFGGSAPSQQALEGLAVGQSAPMGSGQAPAAPQAGFQPPQAASILPPREVMADLFKSPGTRPLAIQLVQAAQGLQLDANDPVKQLQYRKALIDLQNAGQKNIPDGYRATATGLEAIPGGPADPNNPLNLRKTQPSNGITINPDGTVQIGGGGQKLTEGQSKDLVFYTRGIDAESLLSGMDDQLAKFGQQNAGLLPLGLGNYVRTPEFKQAKQAADSFLTAILRKDTGAAITDKEFDQYGPMFLPIPGDDQGTIDQKRRARQVALLAIRSGLGTAEAVAQANEMSLGLQRPNPGKSGRVAPKKTSTGVEWSVETP